MLLHLTVGSSTVAVALASARGDLVALRTVAHRFLAACLLVRDSLGILLIAFSHAGYLVK